MKRFTWSIAVIAACLSLASAKDKKNDNDAPSPADLAAITARGRMLAEYDVAAWHATDVIEDLKPDKTSAPFYIAKKSEGGWTVAFGRLSDMRDKFLVVYEAVQGTRPEFFTSKKYDPPLETTDFYFCAAKAMEAARKDFERQNRPYNIYAIPSATGQLYVYLLPAQTKNGVYPLGGDVRYTFTSDGGSIVEKRQMHKTILEFHLNEKPGKAKLEASFHTHILSNCPEDSDVFYVLTRKPSIPEYVAISKNKMYVVQPDGSIVLGK